MAEPHSINPADYSLAWICALPLELAAAEAILDEHHSSPSIADVRNDYTLGKVAGHNVVVGCLPSGVYGTNSAAAAVTRLLSDFPNVRYGLMVGIGGAAPSKIVDIRLGDVAVSKPVGKLGGVIQYDLGKAVGDGRFEQIGILNQPPAVLLNAVSRLEAEQMRRTDSYISSEMARVLAQNPNMEARFSRPVQEDHLFRATYSHPDKEPSCAACDMKEQVERRPRLSMEPQVHYGTIASGNQVVKDGQQRDEIAQRFDAICFEMEAAGIMNHLPCIVVRGICDYCDSHKNKEWQGYAALAAAICAKKILKFVSISISREAQPGEVKQSSHFMVPFERNPRFLGREDIVRQLTAQVLSIDNRTPRKAAISGLGGMGKTQVALELAYNIRQQDPARSIFWVPSTTIEAVEQAFRNLGRLLGLSDGASGDIKSNVKNYLSSGRVGPWLLIIDNADDSDMWLTSGTSPALKTFLPASKEGFILFTSRNRGLVSRLVGPNVVQLSEMDDITAVALLKDSLIENHLTDDETSTSTLVNKLCGLPLALIQASSFINENGIYLETYLTLLDQQEESVIELLSENFEDEYRYPDTENPVSATWLISFQTIQNSNRLAAKYLAFIACIDYKDIPLSLLSEAETELGKEKALGILRAYSFISQQKNSEFITMHRLIHLATRNWLRKEDILSECTIDAGEHVSKVFPDGEYEERSLWRKYLPHAQVLLERVEFQPNGDTKDYLARNVGKCLRRDGRYNDAEPLLLRSVISMRQRLDANDSRLCWHISELGKVYTVQGRWKEAEEAFIRVLHSRQDVLGENHPDTLRSKHSLATTISLQGRLQEAEAIFREVLKLRKSKLGDEHPETLATMVQLAVVIGDRERLEEAKQLNAKVVELRKAILGSEHPDTLASMGNLAATLSQLGRLEEAEELELKVLEGRYKEAADLALHTLELKKARLGVAHPDTLRSMGHLADVRRDQDRLDDAISLLGQCAELQESQFGPDHPYTISTKSRLKLWSQELHDKSLQRLSIRSRKMTALGSGKL